MAYLTPDEAPDNSVCRALFIPNNEQFLAIVRGALQELILPSSWTKFGTLTPDESASAFVEMFDRFCFNEGVCRMIGEVVAFAGSVSPTDKWLLCDGSEYDVDDYPNLYAVIGDTYGSSGSGLFKVPDLRGRAVSGTGTGTGLSEISLGQQYGEENHTLTAGEMPSHNHAYDPVVTGDLDVEGVGVPQPNAAQIIPLITENTYDTGGDEGHNTIGPRIGLNYLIVARD